MRAILQKPANLSASLLLAVVASSVSAQPQDRGFGTRSPVTATPAGNYYALVIGINDYPPPLKPLKTAVNDAREIAHVLNQTYGFKVQTLIDKEATHDHILDAIEKYRKQLNPEDSLLIYYAGHGHTDREEEKSYWWPADIDPDQDLTSHWILSDELTTRIKVQRARHVLIISDSCYSGGLSRGDETPAGSTSDANFLSRMIAGQSRTLMSSGGDEPVTDSGAQGHSVFAFALLKALRDENSNMFAASELFYQNLRNRVASNSAQVPEYASIRNASRNANEETGDFVFRRVEPIALARPTAAVAPPVKENNTPEAHLADQALIKSAAYILSFVGLEFGGPNDISYVPDPDDPKHPMEGVVKFRTAHAVDSYEDHSGYVTAKRKFGGLGRPTFQIGNENLGTKIQLPPGTSCTVDILQQLQMVKGKQYAAVRCTDVQYESKSQPSMKLLLPAGALSADAPK